MAERPLLLQRIGAAGKYRFWTVPAGIRTVEELIRRSDKARAEYLAEKKEKRGAEEREYRRKMAAHVNRLLAEKARKGRPEGVIVRRPKRPDN